MFKDDKGAIWMGTGSVKSGLVRFDPTRVKRSTTPPIVSIQNIKINNEFISWNDLYAPSNQMIAEHSPKTRRMLSGTAAAIEQQLHYGKLLNQKELITMREKYADCRFDAVSKFYPIPENLVLPNKHNNITFDFAAIETDRPFLVNYSYILDGYDKEWSPPSTKHTATFGNIYEGSHTFRVKAASPSGNWSEPITYTFKVLPPWYRLWCMYAIYLFGGLTAIGITVKWRERNLKREKALLEQKVELRTQQLDERNKLVEDKNKDILDSIYYAKRIQDALLNKETEFTNNTLPEHFILFLAKDIVSGDFFWTTQKDDYWYVAVVDCTGHGVPGAFMSMLGMSFLNSISSVPYLQSPAEILNELRDKVVRELGQKGKSENTKDGMDISLVRINLKTREIQWAGANNALNLVRNNVFEEIKADKQPIGFHHNPGPFTNHSLQLNQGDSIYIYSDGFADQFGGPLGKKFKYRQLEELLLRNSQLKSKEQQEVLEQAFISWKGTLEQVDDVCIIGIKL